VKGKYFLFIGILFLVLGFVFQTKAEVVKIPGNEFKETLTEEEYLEAVKFVLDIDQKGKVGEFWLNDRKSNILALAATYLKIEPANQKISKDWKYKLIHSKNGRYSSDFVIYRNNIAVIILNITQKGKILLKPDQKKLISSIILPIEAIEYYLLVNIYRD